MVMHAQRNRRVTFVIAAGSSGAPGFQREVRDCTVSFGMFGDFRYVLRFQQDRRDCTVIFETVFYRYVLRYQ